MLALVDQRPDGDPGLGGIPGHQLTLHGGPQLRDELLGHGLLDEDPVGADTGLAGVPELAGHTARHGQVQVGRLEDQEGSVAPQLEAQPLDCPRTLPVQNLPHLPRTQSDSVNIVRVELRTRQIYATRTLLN